MWMLDVFTRKRRQEWGGQVRGAGWEVGPRKLGSKGGGRESLGHQDRIRGLWTARERRTLRLLRGSLTPDSGAAGSRIAQKRRTWASAGGLANH